MESNNLMDEKTLVVFPGGGNPDFSPIYADVYALIRLLASHAGYHATLCDLRWPGQFRKGVDVTASAVSFQESVKEAMNYVHDFVKGPFDILARSYGCMVALKYALSNQAGIAMPGKIILWGPLPYWLMWRAYVKDLPEWQKIARTKGLNVDERIFPQMEPIESMLRDISVPTRVAAGTADLYCTPGFIDYLRSVATDNPSVSFAEPVHGVPHEVTAAMDKAMIMAYAKALFGDNIQSTIDK